MSDTKDTLTLIIPKDLLEELRVSLQVWKGKRYVDVWVYAKPPDGSPPRPTKHGLTFSVALLPAVKQALEAVQAAVAKEWKP